MSRPSLTVIAGPNGSGKSTLIRELLRRGIELGRYINADDIARELRLTGDDGALKAQALADELREQSLESDGDFSFETVMSHRSKVDFMRKAAAKGYAVTLFFVATEAPEVNVERVRSRVRLGGHDVPHDRIVARYHRTLSLLPDATLASRSSTVFDNSVTGESVEDHVVPKLRPVAKTTWSDVTLELQVLPPAPGWLLPALRFGAHGYSLSKATANLHGVECRFALTSVLNFAGIDEEALRAIENMIAAGGWTSAN